MDTRSSSAKPAEIVHGTLYSVIFAVSFCHLLNDMMQTLLSALYPSVKQIFELNYTQVGIISLTYQITASLLQPVVGLYTDKHPLPYSLPFGMVSTLFGLLLWSVSHTYGLLLISASLVGLGSSIFHPESARVARMASGGRHGLAQSLFQVGGNAGQAIGPVMVALIALNSSQQRVAWFALAALLGMGILTVIGYWYKHYGLVRAKASARRTPSPSFPRAKILRTIFILAILIFSKQVYLASITTYYQFYLIQRFHVSVETAVLFVGLFGGAVALGTIVGGLLGDRFGRKYVIWFSVLGTLPFTLMLPYVDLSWTAALSVVIGFILSSAFPAIVVYAQELVPGNVGLISGLFFGFAFGLSGIGAALLGRLADATSVEYVYSVCSFLPLLGLFAGLLPNLRSSAHPEIEPVAEE